MLDKFANHQFTSTKMQQNTLFPHLYASNDNEYIGTILPNMNKVTQIGHQNNKEEERFTQQDICDLQEMWYSVQTKKEGVIAKKTQIASICDEPQTLTNEEMEQIFGNQTQQDAKQEQQAEDLGELWDMVDKLQQDVYKKQQTLKKQTGLQPPQIKNEQQPKQISTNTVIQKQSQPQIKQIFYEVEQKQVQTEGRTCLTLGKDFVIFDYNSFMTTCFTNPVYCYFGFTKTINQKYVVFDLTTGQHLMVCSVQKYEQFLQASGQHRRVEYQKNYCLKIRLSESNEPIATIWQKQITNGLLYNIRHYNTYQSKYDQSVALIEITDSYIGNNCYCNTNVFISPRFSSHPGQLKMKLSLKNGYLIANMGVTGIKSAPYNCRLENPSNSFVYLLGLLDKEEEKFIVRVGQGISPVIAFATSIGRKRYIDSFKQ